MNDTTEERSLPPTEKKLRDARRKGQVFRSADMVAGATTTAALLVIWFGLGDLAGRTTTALGRITEAAVALPFLQATRIVSDTVIDALAPFAIRVGLVSVAASVLTNMVITRGLLFTFEPMKPKAENLSPIAGLKRMFALHGLIEFVKNLIKTALLVAAGIATGMAGLNAILRAPTCGLVCVEPLLSAVARPLLVAAIIVLLAAGLIDIVVQRWLFRRQMRMSHTERKRERRDQDGMPEIRSAQRRGRQELMQGAGQLGVAAATALIQGDDVVVGVRYVQGETPVPLVVCKGRGTRGQHLLALGLEAGIARTADPELAEDLHRRISPGNFITLEFFNPVARALHIAATQGR